MKVLVAIPTFESVLPDTFKSVYGLDDGGHDVLFDFVRGYDCATARNRIADQALSEKTDFVLMVDSDVVLPSDALVNLMEDQRDVCLGFYSRRSDGLAEDVRTSISKLGERDYTDWYMSSEIRDLRESGVTKFEVHGGGMGCALIRTSVFERVSYPWFDWVNYADRRELSEDLRFCEWCHAANIRIYADSRVGCGHVVRRIQGVM